MSTLLLEVPSYIKQHLSTSISMFKSQLGWLRGIVAMVETKMDTEDADSERDNCTFLLKSLSDFMSEDLLSRNSGGFVKVLMLREDARLQFVTKRFRSGTIDKIQFLNQLLELVEKESKLIFDAVFANCSLHDAKLASRQERETEWKGAAVGIIDLWRDRF